MQPTPKEANDKRDYMGKLRGSRQIRGTWAELVACAWLLEKGFKVFRNVSNQGPVDMVVEISGRFVGVDVKLTQVDITNIAHPSVAKGSGLTDFQQNAGIVQLYVTHEGVCAFDREHLNNLYRTAAKQAKELAESDGLDTTRGVRYGA